MSQADYRQILRKTCLIQACFNSQGITNPLAELLRSKHQWMKILEPLTKIRICGNPSILHYSNALRHENIGIQLNFKTRSDRIATAEKLKRMKLSEIQFCKPCTELIQDYFPGKFSSNSNNYLKD